jgi:hypothetical protein
MLNTVLLFVLIAALVIFGRLLFVRLAVIHALTNSGMGSALRATVVALRSDREAKRELARLIGGNEQVSAADSADRALKDAQELLDRHNRGQHLADKSSSVSG